MPSPLAGIHIQGFIWQGPKCAAPDTVSNQACEWIQTADSFLWLSVCHIHVYWVARDWWSASWDVSQNVQTLTLLRLRGKLNTLNTSRKYVFMYKYLYTYRHTYVYIHINTIFCVHIFHAFILSWHCVFYLRSDKVWALSCWYWWNYCRPYF